MELNKYQEAWLQDLETTEAPQDGGSLRTKYGYCCLGRACEVLGLSSVYDEKEREYVYEGRGCEALPESAASLLNMTTHGEFREPVFSDGKVANSLVTLNDTAGWTFKEIARYIRNNPENVFFN